MVIDTMERRVVEVASLRIRSWRCSGFGVADGVLDTGLFVITAHDCPSALLLIWQQDAGVHNGVLTAEILENKERLSA